MATTARLAFDATVADPTEPAHGPSVDVRRRAPSMPPGYELGPVLGRGGMGEVVLAHDLAIGRDVAIKRMNGEGGDQELRFLCEARIQARLDHPAIVPVHEIGEDSNGRPYFTMRRVAGHTLAELLAQPTTRQHRLLRALVDVCLAVDFAHARGVVHRDLKPSNIMLGDYGEVYVLDWGVARILDEHVTERSASFERELHATTEVGAVLGTPGYAAPEQLLAAATVTPAADVYALGAILFEILTRSPLHPRGVAGIASTLDTPTRAPSEEVAGIAPELDVLCTAALAAAHEQRISARMLADGLQRFIDGERDLERRRVLAAEQVAIARAALSSGDPRRRGEVLRAVGRALALDPECEAEALLEGALARSPDEQDRDHATSVARDANPYAASVARDGADQARRSVPRPGVSVALHAGLLLLVVALERAFGPFVVGPVLLLASLAPSGYPRGADARRLWLACGPVLAFVTLLVLEAAGLLAPTWTTRDGALVIHGAALRLEGGAGSALIVAANLAPVVIATWLARARALAVAAPTPRRRARPQGLPVPGRVRPLGQASG